MLKPAWRWGWGGASWCSSQMSPSEILHHCIFLFLFLSPTVNLPAECDFSHKSVLNNRLLYWHAYVGGSYLIWPSMFYSPVVKGVHLQHEMFCSFLHRARQKHTTKETAMPGESKALRPLRVVLRRGTSLILCPPPPPHLRPEPLALPQTASPAKRVRKQKTLTEAETETEKMCMSFVVVIIISILWGCSEA